MSFRQSEVLQAFGEGKSLHEWASLQIILFGEDSENLGL